MKQTRRFTRDWLHDSVKTKFENVLNEAKISPRQKEILHLKFCDNLLNYQIAMRLNVSQETIRNEIKHAYDNIYKVLTLM